MASETPSVTNVGGLIPNVWFDIIGRVVPGTYLLAGLFDVLPSPPSAQVLNSCLSEFPVVGPAVGFLLVIVLAYFAGFLLGHVSYPVVGRLLGRWSRVKLGDIHPVVREMLSQSYGANWNAGAEHGAVLRARDFCSFFIWNKNPNLAIIFSRWDAEALASQSIVLISLVLAVMYWWTAAWYYAVPTFLVIAVIAWVGFRHHSRRAILSRFDMFLVLTRIKDPS